MSGNIGQNIRQIDYRKLQEMENGSGESNLGVSAAAPCKAMLTWMPERGWLDPLRGASGFNRGATSVTTCLKANE